MKDESKKKGNRPNAKNIGLLGMWQMYKVGNTNSEKKIVMDIYQQ